MKDVTGARGDDVHTRDESQDESRDYGAVAGLSSGRVNDRSAPLSAARRVAAVAAATRDISPSRDTPLFCLLCLRPTRPRRSFLSGRRPVRTVSRDGPICLAFTMP